MSKYVVSNTVDGAGSKFPRQDTLDDAIAVAMEQYKKHFVVMEIKPVINELDFECGDPVALIYMSSVWVKAEASDE